MITVPFSRLFDGCEFDAERGSIVWHYNDIDNYFVLKQKCFVQVVQTTARGEKLDVIGAMCEAGFGVVDWW